MAGRRMLRLFDQQEADEAQNTDGQRLLLPEYRGCGDAHLSAMPVPDGERAQGTPITIMPLNYQSEKAENPS